jgi:hypothetical protein
VFRLEDHREIIGPLSWISGEWLQSLDLERHETAFRDNEIDDAVLPNLTADDLKDLGVLIVGHGRRLLEAIASLRAHATVKGPPSAPVRILTPHPIPVVGLMGSMRG